SPPAPRLRGWRRVAWRVEESSEADQGHTWLLTMPGRTYATVAPELADDAETIADHFKSFGYVIRVERQEVGFPYTPTLVCVRSRAKIIVEVDSAIRT